MRFDFPRLGVEDLTSNLPYGNTWRKHRRLLDEGLKKDLMLSYHAIYTEKVHLLLDQLLHDPAEFREHCKT